MSDEPKGASDSNLCVVVGLAFTEPDGFALDRTVRVARQVPRSELHVVHVFDTEPSEARSRELVDHLRLDVNERPRPPAASRQ